MSRTSPVPDVYADLLLGGADLGGRPWLALGMVASVDGAIAVDGRSGGLGGPADRLALTALRDATDVVLVGAETLRTEGYERIGSDAHRRARRLAKGLAPSARLAVVSRTGDLPAVHPLLWDAAEPAVVITAAATADRVRRALDERRGTRRGPTLLVAGEADLDAGALRDGLASLGLPRILCEGGPTLAAALVTADAVDEVLLTVAPWLVGEGPRLLAGPIGGPRRLRLVSAAPVGDELLLRYRASTDGEG